MIRSLMATILIAPKPSGVDLVVALIEEVAPNYVSYMPVSIYLRYFPFSCDNHAIDDFEVNMRIY